MIYESPDGGKTVYSRDFGSHQRTLVKRSHEFDDLDRVAKWLAILELAKTCPDLEKALQHIEVLYELIRSKN